jgi:hypothetical protein
LRDEYYQLSRKSTYQVLGQFTWKQPANNQNKVSLPLTQHNGWQMQGTIRVRQGTYYQLDTELQLSPPYDPQSFFSVNQKQRLNKNVIYYLDHPQIGMLVKIHPLT